MWSLVQRAPITPQDSRSGCNVVMRCAHTISDSSLTHFVIGKPTNMHSLVQCRPYQRFNLLHRYLPKRHRHPRRRQYPERRQHPQQLQVSYRPCLTNRRSLIRILVFTTLTTRSQLLPLTFFIVLNLATITPQAPHGLGATSSVTATDIGATISAANGLPFLETQAGKSCITIISIASPLTCSAECRDSRGAPSSGRSPFTGVSIPFQC